MNAHLASQSGNCRCLTLSHATHRCYLFHPIHATCMLCNPSFRSCYPHAMLGHRFLCSAMLIAPRNATAERETSKTLMLPNAVTDAVRNISPEPSGIKWLSPLLATVKRMVVGHRRRGAKSLSPAFFQSSQLDCRFACLSSSSTSRRGEQGMSPLGLLLAVDFSALLLKSLLSR